MHSSRLTPAPTLRQLQILRLLSQGLTYKEIAAELRLSQGTVKQYTLWMRHRMHAKTTTQAVAIYQRGLINANT